VITLVLGGNRSGKSEVAERLTAAMGEPITYVATADADAEGFGPRIDAHRARRPATWTTVEQPVDLPGTLMRLDVTVRVDSLGLWDATAADFNPDVEGLSRAITLRRGSTVLVSDEVGLGVHPPTALGVQFADALGACNRRVAEVCDRVLLVIAGRTLELPREI
jgi:adenosyl cobinamide kinase/adenosyl cobinamide phosphate guanylyltransferase